MDMAENVDYPQGKITDGERIATIKNSSRGCDSRRYFLALNSSAGVATTHGEREAKNRTWPKFWGAFVELSAIGSQKLLTDSRISAVKKYDLRSSVARLPEWRNFHKARIYKTKPSKHTAESYPLPNKLLVGPGGEIAPIDSEDDDPVVAEDDADTWAESSLDDALRLAYIPSAVEV